MEIVNIAAYKFIGIPEPALWQAPMQDRCVQLALKGTIIMATEGINISLAGVRSSIDAILDYLRNDTLFEGRFADLTVKESISSSQPFRRMLVRLSEETITMRHPTIRPEGGRAPSVDPATLKSWIEKGCDDEGRPLVLLDTRNIYEVDEGTFEGAIDLRLETFGQFPEAVRATAGNALTEGGEKAIVTFCTGGIRCEKAALYMQELGMTNVFQLDGGILRYFEDVGGVHWRGRCFVFDDRRSVDPSLRETEE